ncbi:hypothetical protein [Liquorilactobacillus mali]|uniref:Uncharacterized protein n=1 Tax=Liquorilactobacillus mali KCTC 3596 = DSM 20444 TaxID=1046596 RepID=A0A0R2EDB2_9LACO|nr:hypothetical protein [Liquorilactobacillus mali]KRN10778.1 hypothetical protein FD00_GL002020 [Liquorilactobacillus mali KCTC 3596 = DSM 20444]
MQNRMDDLLENLIEDEFSLEILNYLKNNNIAVDISENDILMNSERDIITMYYILNCYKKCELEAVVECISKCELYDIENMVVENIHDFEWCFGTQQFPNPFLQITASEIKELTSLMSNEHISNFIHSELKNCYRFGVISTSRMLLKFLSRLKAHKNTKILI